MKRTVERLVVLVLLLSDYGLGQENYTGWKYWRSLTVNTSASGANVAVTQANFPMLVRLNASNFTFSHAAGNGSDIRFTASDGITRLKHQIESWDSAGQTATLWVLMPAVLGNNSTQSIRIYSWKNGTADSSNGSAVFDTLDNFQGVFHLGEATGDTARDATYHQFKGIPKNRGGVNPIDTTGAIGHAKNFLGVGTTNNGGSYQILTSAGGNTFTNDALNFQNDSSTFGGNGQPLYTISAWIYVSEFPTGTNNLKGIVAKSTGSTSATQYCLRLKDPATDAVNSANDTQRVEFVDPIPAVYKSGVNRISTGNWYHIAAVRSGARGDSTRLRVWVNGYAPPPGTGITSTSITSTVQQNLNVYIGSLSNDSGYFNGNIDEVEFSSVARDSNWLMLCYQTQKPGSTVVSAGPENVNPDPPGAFTYKTNPLVLRAGVAMVSDSALVTGATSFSVTPALPAGLNLNATNGAISGTPAASIPIASANYTVSASNTAGVATTVVNIMVLAAPLITGNPVVSSPVLNPPPAGGVANFGIKTTGSTPMIYKWVHIRGVTIDTLTDGGVAPAAVFSNTGTDTLTITNPPFSDSLTTYKCVVRNSAGIAVSTAGTLLVRSGAVGIWASKLIRVHGMGPFSFHIPPASDVSNVRILVENMGGRAVWTKIYEVDASNIVGWNAEGFDGRPVAPGMYVVKMKPLNAENKSVGEATRAGINRR